MRGGNGQLAADDIELLGERSQRRGAGGVDRADGAEVEDKLARAALSGLGGGVGERRAGRGRQPRARADDGVDSPRTRTSTSTTGPADLAGADILLRSYP